MTNPEMSETKLVGLGPNDFYALGDAVAICRLDAEFSPEKSRALDALHRKFEVSVGDVRLSREDAELILELFERAKTLSPDRDDENIVRAYQLTSTKLKMIFEIDA